MKSSNCYEFQESNKNSDKIETSLVFSELNLSATHTMTNFKFLFSLFCV